MGTTEIIVIALALLIAVGIGKNIALWIPDEQRKIIGGIALLIGVVLAIYGIMNANSTTSRITRDTSGLISIGIGILLGVVGISALSYKGRSKQASSTRKCPYCAETIQIEAKVCRYCGRELDEPISKRI
jgi:hypothetical protein